MSKTKNESETIEVLPIGSLVSVNNSGETKTVATINGVLIRGNGVILYDCSWWNGGSVTTSYLYHYEVTPTVHNPVKLKIGFCSSKDN